ncbi:MAG: hypothetical protein RL685_4723 [Pseudomonadota bacterium]|jgi:hypothetical protein
MHPGPQATHAVSAAGQPRLRARACWLAVGLFAAGLFAGLAVPSRAQAAELSARGPATCPDVAELTFRVERAIGMPLSHAAPLRFAVKFEPQAAGYAAQFEVAGGATVSWSAARHFSAADCSRLGDAVGLAIALALGAAAPAEPATAVAPIEPADEAPTRTLASELESARPVPTPPAPVPPRDELAPAPVSEPAAVLTPVLAAALILDSGSLPAAGLGLSMAAELRFRRLALRVGGLLLFDQQAALRRPELPAAGAELGLALGNMALCTVAFGNARAAVAALVCGGWELGRLEGTGTGIPVPRRGSALWTAPRLDAQLSWAPLGGPVRLVAQLMAATPLQRADFFLRDLGSVHRPPVVVGRAGVGLEVGFE